MDRSSADLLFSALSNLEKAVLQNKNLIKQYKTRITELSLINDNLKEALQNADSCNKALTKQIQEFSLHERIMEKQELLIDNSTSHEVELSLNQLKNLLAKKNK